VSSKQETGKAAALRLELKLAPSESGLRELKNWPSVEFSPDFAVAASGVVRLELAGQMIGTKDGKFMAVETRLAQRLQEDINFWLPDYVGGFAAGLGAAVLKLKEGASQSRASFIDEPLALHFRRQGVGNQIMVGFEADSKGIRMTELTEPELIRVVRETLENFQRQLLDLNPSLSAQRDVIELGQQIKKLS
jgi:hypothetical protein